MSESASVASGSVTNKRSLPGFSGVFSGIWLMTWRSQLTLRKLPSQLGILLVLPILIYISIKSPEAWARRHISMGDPDEALHSFTRRLNRARIPFPPETREALHRILSEEMQKGELSWKEQPGENPEARLKRLKDHIADGYSQILTRGKTALNDDQYEKFESNEEDARDAAIGRVSEVLVPWNRTEPFYHWLMDFYFFIILPLTCVRGAGPLIRDELQADTLGFLITRPVGRARLLLAKYAAQVAWLEMVLLLETLLLFAAGAARQVPSLDTLLPLVLGVQILVVLAWSALGLLLGQLTSNYMAMALLYGAIVEMGIGRIPTNINTLSIMRHLQTLLTHNHELQAIYAWPSGEMATAIGALMVAPVLFLSVAALLFSLVEYHHAAEMQK
jgi:ABC-2 family transporter protein